MIFIISKGYSQIKKIKKYIKRDIIKIFTDGIKKAAVKRMFPVWREMGHCIVKNPNEADVQLSSIKIKNKGGLPIVLRLDGIYYDKAEDFNIRNSEISKTHSTVNAVIYQSHMSKTMCEKYLTKRKTKIYSVIYNGVDESKWYNPKEHDDINVVSCAKWRRWKRLPEIIEVFYRFIEHYPEAKLHIIGPMSKGSKIIEHRNIIYHNPKLQISFDKIKKIYQTMDMCLYLAKKDWCPSSVVETIAAGIPVITTNACGGATEMCKLTKGCVVVDGEKESLEPDYIYRGKYNEVPKKAQENLLKAMSMVAESKHRAILPKELRIETTAEKYIEIMRKII